MDEFNVTSAIYKQVVEDMKKLMSEEDIDMKKKCLQPCLKLEMKVL